VRIGGVPKSKSPFLSDGVRVGDLVFISGQVPIDHATGKLVDGDIRAQTRKVLDNLAHLLSRASCSLKDVTKTTVFLSRVGDFAAMNEVYQEFFPHNPPARSTVEARLAVDALVEIEAIAVRGRGEDNFEVISHLS
jgi:2-iminobutanoate/2-iminopropanoate deaminase